MPLRISSSSTVQCPLSRSVHGKADSVSGLEEQLFERLTSSPAEPFLKALQELFINFWGVCTRPLWRVMQFR